MRIINHPILGEMKNLDKVTIYCDGIEIFAQKGEPIAAALLSAGVRTFRKTVRTGEPRGVYCGIGQCNDCIMEVNGIPNIRTCVTLVEEGMIIKMQEGLGKIGGLND